MYHVFRQPGYTLGYKLSALNAFHLDVIRSPRKDDQTIRATSGVNELPAAAEMAWRSSSAVQLRDQSIN
jgi:hypothetical protein